MGRGSASALGGQILNFGDGDADEEAGCVHTPERNDVEMPRGKSVAQNWLGVGDMVSFLGRVRTLVLRFGDDQ